MGCRSVMTITRMPAPLRSANSLKSPKTLREVLGYNVRVNRVAQKMSQEQLGFAAHLDRTFVSQVERGRVNISVDNIEKLARALAVAPATLLLSPAGLDEIHAPDRKSVV